MVQNATAELVTECTIKIVIEASQRSYFILDALNSPSASVADTAYLAEALVRTV